MTLKSGDAFFLKGTGGISNPKGAHLCVCLTSPCAKGNLLVVPIVTYYPGFDTSCMIAVGDHDFIKHASCAAYGHAKKVYGVMVEKPGGEYEISSAVSPSALKALRDGLFKSGDTPPFILDYAKKQGLTPPK